MMNAMIDPRNMKTAINRINFALLVQVEMICCHLLFAGMKYLSSSVSLLRRKYWSSRVGTECEDRYDIMIVAVDVDCASARLIAHTVLVWFLYSSFRLGVLWYKPGIELNLFPVYQGLAPPELYIDLFHVRCAATNHRVYPAR